MELEPNFCQIIQQDKSNTTAQLLQSVRLEPKFGHSTDTPRLQWSYGQNSVKLYNKTSLILQQSYSKAPVEVGPNFGQILQLNKPNTTAQLLQGSNGARAKIWSNIQDKPNTTGQLLQASSRARA